MRLIDRRRAHISAANEINRAIVRGVVTTIIILAGGSVYIATTGGTVPELFGTIMTGFGGGLIGYLGKDHLGAHSVSTGPVEEMTVTQQEETVKP